MGNLNIWLVGVLPKGRYELILIPKAGLFSLIAPALKYGNREDYPFLTETFYIQTKFCQSYHFHQVVRHAPH